MGSVIFNPGNSEITSQMSIDALKQRTQTIPHGCWFEIVILQYAERLVNKGNWSCICGDTSC
jgi:hypothetical protein